MSSSPVTDSNAEVKKIRALMRNPLVEQNPAGKREVLQKVIALVTAGVDTSDLFADMILSCGTSDVVSKKLIYLYLTTNSVKKPDLAVLSINTFVKECADGNHVVRGLALRSFASLRVPQLLDFLIPCVFSALDDTLPYVRRIAVMCTLKIHQVSSEEYRNHGFFEKVSAMLYDPDPQVCINALKTLQVVSEAEAKREEPGAVLFIVTKPILYHLLNNIRRFSEWGQVAVVDLVQHYEPTSEDELFNVMNLLDELLQGGNSAVTMACANAFIHVTKSHPTMHRQVLDRLRQPLLLMMTSVANAEASFAVLCHVKLLAKRDSSVFNRDYKHFFCRLSDPTYVKTVKMDILTIIADETSATSIANELAVYSEDRNKTTACWAIRCMAMLALRLVSASPAVLKHFFKLLSVGQPHVRGAILVAMTDYFRVYRNTEMVHAFLEVLLRSYEEKNFTDEASRISFVWMLGEFGEDIPEAPYIIEAFTANLSKESSAFCSQLLTSAAVLLFKRAPEMQHILGTVLHTLINHRSDADVVDRATLYYRLLQQDPLVAQRVILSEKNLIDVFAEDRDADRTDRILEEFNTLSVVYGLPYDSIAVNGATQESSSSSAEEDEEVQSTAGDKEDLLDLGTSVHAEVPPPPVGLTSSEDATLKPVDYPERWKR